MKLRQIEQCRDDEPCRIDAHKPTEIETLDGRILCPREPQAYTAEKQKHVHADVAHSPKTKEGVGAGKVHMKQHDEQHGSSHQLATEAADVCKFYIRNTFHSVEC